MLYSISWIWLLAAALVLASLAGSVTWLLARDGFGDQGIPAGIAFLIVGLMAFAIPMAIRESHAFQVHCESLGGHTRSHTSTVTTIGANGKPAVGTDTTTYCLSDDGRILDIS